MVEKSYWLTKSNLKIFSFSHFWCVMAHLKTMTILLGIAGLRFFGLCVLELPSYQGTFCYFIPTKKSLRLPLVLTKIVLSHSSIWPGCIVLCCIALHCIVLHCIALHCIALHCIALHCIALYCIVLYCIVLYCIVLYCIAQAISSSLMAYHRLGFRLQNLLAVWEESQSMLKVEKSNHPDSRLITTIMLNAHGILNFLIQLR